MALKDAYLSGEMGRTNFDAATRLILVEIGSYKGMDADNINWFLDSAFFVQIQNNSLNLAKNVVVKINFGESSVTSCETIPAKLISNEKIVSSIISFSVGDIQRKDSLYVYCLLSHPVFESILLTGSNLFSNELYEFKQYISPTKDNNSSFIKFFKGVASVVAVIFIGYFTNLTLSALNRRFGVYLSKW